MESQGVLREGPLAIVLYAVLGVVAGALVNRFNRLLDSRLPKMYASPWAAAPLKLLPAVLVLAGTELPLPGFAMDWQSTTPGVFFVSMFFGMQTGLMEDLARLA